MKFDDLIFIYTAASFASAALLFIVYFIIRKKR